MRKLMLTVALVGAFVVSAATVLAATTIQNLSGYETSAGGPCKIAGEAGTCGVTFSGWTGGSGAEAGGWAFPGDGQGVWNAKIDYTGTPGTVEGILIKRGSWKLSYKITPRINVTGTVTGGAVIWPAAGGDCGVNVATVSVSATGVGLSGPQIFTGCLDDRPTTFPPRIWGAFAY